MRCWEMVLDWISSLALDLAEHLGLEILQRAFYLEKETVAYMVLRHWSFASYFGIVTSLLEDRQRWP